MSTTVEYVPDGGGAGGAVDIFDSAGNPLNSTAGALNVAIVSGGGSNASVGATGTTAPTSATEIGVIDGTGKLQGASSSNPVRVDPTGTTIQPVSGTVAVSNFPATQPVSGSVSVSNFPATQPVSGAVTVSGTATVSQGTAAADTAPWYIRESAPSTANWSQAAISFNSSGANTLVAASGSTTIRVMRIFFVNSGTAPTNITISDTTVTNFSGAFLLNPGGVFNASCDGEPLFVTAAAKGFQLNSSVAVQISGTIWYTQS